MAARWPGRHWAGALAGVAGFTLLVRSVWFGDPVVDADEQFYLLVGDRWLHGAIPYIDIWDRKPPGLFALFAGIRLLGGDGVIQYQIVAALFAAATSVMIAVIARRIAGERAAILAALSYPLTIGWSGGMGGQSPVFYNLPVAVAAVIVLRLAIGDARRLATGGAVAMLLVGVAMQIKTSAVFEGVYFGIVLLTLAWASPMQGAGVRLARAAVLALLWMAAALLPTALAYAGFAFAGHGAAFVFANVTSILLRHNDPAGQQAIALGKMVARLSPEIVALAAGGVLAARGAAPWRARSNGTAAYRFVLGWLGVAAAGVLIFGNYFNHYALPLMVPLAIAVAPAFAMEPRRVRVALAALVLGVNGVAYVVTWRHILARSGDRDYAMRITDVIRRNLRGGRLYVYNGEPILYHLTGSALPTRWPFPYHLSFAREAAALGVDPAAEVRRIMATRPTVVVDTWDPADPDLNRTTQAIVRGDLARDYRLVAAFRLRGDLRQVWARLPGR